MADDCFTEDYRYKINTLFTHNKDLRIAKIPKIKTCSYIGNCVQNTGMELFVDDTF